MHHRQMRQVDGVIPMPSPTELAAIVEGEKLTKRDRETILFALSLASY